MKAHRQRLLPRALARSPVAHEDLPPFLTAFGRPVEPEAVEGGDDHGLGTAEPTWHKQQSEEKEMHGGVCKRLFGQKDWRQKNGGSGNLSVSNFSVRVHLLRVVRLTSWWAMLIQ